MVWEFPQITDVVLMTVTWNKYDRRVDSQIRPVLVDWSRQIPRVLLPSTQDLKWDPSTSDAPSKTQAPTILDESTPSTGYSLHFVNICRRQADDDILE